jgi:hypothetical protein
MPHLGYLRIYLAAMLLHFFGNATRVIDAKNKPGIRTCVFKQFTVISRKHPETAPHTARNFNILTLSSAIGEGFLANREYLLTLPTLWQAATWVIPHAASLNGVYHRLGLQKF